MHAPAQQFNDLKNKYIRESKMRDDALLLNQEFLDPPTPPPKPPPLKPSQADPVATANNKLKEMADKSNDILLKVSTVWPFTLFVNDIIIDPYKVNVIYREFFYSERIHSILIRDITDVFIETSPFFATIKIVDLGFVENTVDIAYLKKEDALNVRKIIQGLVIAQKQSIDLSNIGSAKIKEKTEQLGNITGVDDNLESEI